MAGMQFTSPVGRMVFGSVWEGSTTDSDGKQRVVKSGPNAGKPATVWSWGVAFPKVMANGGGNLEYNELYKLIHAAGRAGYPQFYNGPVDPITGVSGLTPGVTFATKIKDGDGFDTKGKPNNQKEGWAGNWVVVFSSQFAPRVFDINVGLDPTQQLQDKTRVLPGDYVAINGTVEANVGAQTPGVYVNGNMVCFVGGGPRIVSGPKADEAFKGVMAGALPPGCVPGASPANMVTPVPNAGGVPTVPGVPSVHAGAGMVPNATVSVPPAVPVPHDANAKALADGWVVHPTSPTHMYKGSDVKVVAEVLALYPAPVAVPTVPAVPAVPVVPAVPQLSPAALVAGFTSYAQATANGWTDALLRQHGYLA